LLLLLVVTTLSCSGGSGVKTISVGPGVSVNVESNTEVTVKGSESTLYLPSSIFSENISVSLSEDAVDVTELAGYTLLSKSISLHFSQAQQTKEKAFVLAFTLSKEKVQSLLQEGKGLFAKVRNRGEHIAYGEGKSATWSLHLGEYDENTGEYSVAFYATAETIEVALVAGDPLTVFIGSVQKDRGEESFGAKSVSKASPLATELTRTIYNFEETPWAVICEPAKMTVAERALCQEGNARYQLERVHERIRSNTQLLVDQGWSKAKLLLTTALSLQIARGDINAFTGSRDLPIYLPVAFVAGRANTACSNTAVKGCYDPNNGKLEFTELALIAEDQLRCGDTVMHELFHAVQAATLPDVEDVWFNEATSSAMGAWAVAGGNANTLINSTYCGEHRDWNFGLDNSSDDYRPYKTMEFFTGLANGEISYLPQVFAALSTSSSSLTYTSLNDALSTVPTVHATLGENYMNVVRRKIPSFNYPHCSQMELQTEDDLWFGLESGALQSMSSDCYNTLETNLADGHCWRVELEAVGANASDLRLAVNGKVEDENVAFLRASRLEMVVGDVKLNRTAEADAYRLHVQEIAHEEACPLREPDVLPNEGDCLPREVHCFNRPNQNGPADITCSLRMTLGTCTIGVVGCTQFGTGGVECHDINGIPIEWGNCGAEQNALQTGVPGDVISIPQGNGCNSSQLCRRLLLCAE